MKRILHSLDNLEIGGIQSFIMNIYRQIDRNSYQFDFLIHHSCETGFEDEIKKLGGKIYVLPSRHEGLLKNKRALKIFFAKHKEYDVVHMHESSLSYIEPLIAAKKAGIRKRIIHSHSTTQKGNPLHMILHKFNQKRIYSIATDVFACSDKAAKWLIGKKNYELNRYQFIPNGIDPEKYYFSEKYRREIRNEFNVMPDTSVYGLIGRLTWQKNHKFLLDIFYMIRKLEPNTCLFIVGDGNIKEQLVKKANSLGIFKNIVFTGARKDVEKFYSAFDAFIMPSVNEGLPVTLVEAQAASLPCIVSDNITKDVDISDFIKYVSLKKSSETWAKECIKFRSEHTRKVEKDLFDDSPFNVKNVAMNLCKFYIK